jgi:hypothetical protein
MPRVCSRLRAPGARRAEQSVASRAPSRTDSSSSVVLERFRRDFSSVLVGERLESNGPNRFFEFYNVCERLAEPIPRVLSSWSALASSFMAFAIGPNRFFEFYRVCERLAEPIPRVLSSWSALASLIPRVLSSWSASASKATGRTDSSSFIVFASPGR